MSNTGKEHITITDHLPIIFSYNGINFLTWNVTYDDSKHMVYRDEHLTDHDNRKLTDSERSKFISFKIEILKKIIEKYQIDILCLQECTGEMKNKLETMV